MAQRLSFRICQAFIAIVLCSGTAEALEIRIRGAAKLEAKISSASTMVQVSGRLVDELGRGIRERKVDIVIRDENLRKISSGKATTGLGGTFTYNEELPPATYRVTASFEGSEHHDRAVEKARVTLAPEPIRLTVYSPRFVHGRSKALVHASASTGEEPVVGSASVFMNGNSVGDLMFDMAGRGGFDVSNHLQEGANPIEVVIPGSAYRDEVRATTEIFFAKNLQVDAAASERLDRLRRGIGVTGRVTSGETPIGDLRISVRIVPTEIDPSISKKIRPFRDTAITNENGEFEAFFPATKLVDGIWNVEVEVVPPVGARIKKQAGRIEWTTKVQRAVLNGVWVVALLGLFGIVASYGWVWLKIAWFNRRRRKEALARQEAAFVAEERIVPVRLDSDASGEIVSRDSVRGLVWDVWNQRAVADATITLNGPETFVLTSDDNGWFHITELPGGAYAAEISADGFVRGRLEIEIPHDGIFSNFRIDLVAVPLKIRRLFQSVVEATAGEDLWGRRSPQEIERMLATAFSREQNVVSDGAERNALRQKILEHVTTLDSEEIDGRQLLGAITALVEESYYSGKGYDESLWFVVREIGLRLRGSA